MRKAEQKGEVQAISPQRRSLILALAVLFTVVVLALAIPLGVSCIAKRLDKRAYVNPYKAQTKVAFQAEYLGTTPRKVPTETKNEGRAENYPTYGYTLREAIGTGEAQVAYRNALIAESWNLCTVNTRIGTDGYPKNTYNKIGADGTLYLNGEKTDRTLYKHTASVGLYGGDVADDEPAVIKRMTFTPRGYLRGYNVTGLYAPAGEVVKLEISEADMEKTGGIKVHIGQALYNGKANNIWVAKNAMNRMPVILNTLVIDKSTAELVDGVYTAYIGSFLGGPIYICNEGVTFTATISGAVNYRHFILGYTTPEDLAETSKSSAPYFDLEVWEYGVLHSGPKMYAAAFDYDKLYDAGVLWDKIACVSTQVSRQGIVFLYDPFVAAGAAVAFPGQGSVNCPAGWMASSLNYQAYVNSGTWGNMHEYNHNFQGWGLGYGGEVTNNAMTLVEYSLFTKISSARSLGKAADGMGGWNRYTSAPFALDQITAKKFENGNYGLAGYATTLHNFGQELFMNAVRTSGGQSPDKWLRATTNATGYNFTYFINTMLGIETSAGVLTDAQAAYPMFVPVSTVYQTGRSLTVGGEKRDIQTMQPYHIQYGKDFDIDLRPYTTTHEGKQLVNRMTGIYSYGSVLLPDGFTYTIKNVSQPEHGRLVDKGDRVYTYTPDPNHMESGKIRVTLGITKDDGAFPVEDVELILQLEQTHEMNKAVLERTVYTFAEGTATMSAKEAYEAGFAGATGTVSGDNDNAMDGRVVQNANAEIWVDGGAGLVADKYYVLQGKVYIDETAKYRMALRGRWDCALYTAVNDGEYAYTAGVEVVNPNSRPSGFYLDDETTYHDFTDLKAGDWLHFRAVLKGASSAFIGVGWGKFTPQQGVIDEDGNVVGDAPETISIGYLTAYRSSYRFPTTEFKPDYFYTRSYPYTYTEVTPIENVVQKVVDTNYEPWDSSFDINRLFESDETNIHTKKYWTMSAATPFIMTVKVDGTLTTNMVTLCGRTDKPGGNNQIPKTFTLSFADENNNVVHEQAFTNVPKTGEDVIAVLDKKVTFRYYTLTVTDSYGGCCALSNVKFSDDRSSRNGDRRSPANLTYQGDWSTRQAMCTFGQVYVGNKKASATIEFDGTRFAVLSLSDCTAQVEVYIDGKKVETLDVNPSDGSAGIAYISDNLTAGKHTAMLVVKKGQFNIESVVTW